jgi:hypothetical protein
MDEHESLNHSKWECKYHVVFIPKCRRKTLYFQLRQLAREIGGGSTALGYPARKETSMSAAKSHLIQCDRKS